MQHAVAQQTHARRRGAQTLDGAADLEAFGAIDQPRHGQIAEINFIAAARETHGRRPDLNLLSAQKRQHARGFTSGFVTVRNQQNFPLPALTDLRQRRLQGRLDVGLVAIEVRTEIDRRHLLARQ